MSSKTNKLSPVELMADPKHMRAWLQSKKPSAIVTKNICDSCTCLGANFLKAKGHPGIRFGAHRFGGKWRLPTWFELTFFDNALLCGVPITAKQALAAIARACSSIRGAS